MISIRLIKDFVSRHEAAPPRMIEWRMQSPADCFEEIPAVVLVNGEVVAGDDLFEPLDDGSSVIGILTPMGGFDSGWWQTGPAYWLFPDTFEILYPWRYQTPAIGQDSAEARQPKSFGGALNDAREGATIPVVYGELMVGGVVLQQYTREGPARDELYHGQYLISHGPVQSIAGQTADADGLTASDFAADQLYINGLDITTLDRVEISVRLGSDPQTCMPGFEDIVIQYPQNYELTDVDKFVYTSKDAVNGMQFNITFQSGLFKVSDDGDTKKTTSTFTLEWYDESDVIDTDPPNFTQSFSVRDNIASPFTWTIWVNGLATARYKVRIYRGEEPGYLHDDRRHDKSLLVAVKEVLTPNGGGLQYNNMALIGIKVRASDQLSGGLPQISARVKGRKCYDSRDLSTAWTQNPALMVRDFLLDTTYGLGNVIDSGGINVSDFEDWADYCDAVIDKWTGAGATEARHLANFVLNTQQDAWPMLQRIAGEAGASLVHLGNAIRVKREIQRSPVQVFNYASIRSNEGGNPVLSVADANPDTQADAIKVNFRNEEKNFESDSIFIPHTVIETDSTDVLNIDLFSVTSPTRANRYGYRAYRREKMLTQSWTWQAGLDSIACEPGDVVYVAREVPEVYHGRIADYTAGVDITLDRSISFTANTLYTYIEQDASDDSINERDFEMGTGPTDTLPFGPLAAGDATDRKWIIGKRVWFKEPVLITRIGNTDDGMRELEGTNYAEDIYTDAADSLNPIYYAPGLGSAPSAVTNLAVSEAWFADGISRLTVTFDDSDGARYALWYRSLATSGLAWIYIGQVIDDDSASYSHPFNLAIATGTPIEIGVQSIASDGQRTAENAASVTYTIARDDDNNDVFTYPANVQNLVMTPVSGNQYTLSWDAVATKDNYVVTYGRFNGGMVLGSPTGESITIYVGRHLRYVNVKAVLNGVYSKRNAAMLIGPPTHTGTYGSYTTRVGYIEANWQNGTDDVQYGTKTGASRIRNGLLRRWQNNDDALTQVTLGTTLQYLTEICDISTSQTVHVSLAVRLLPWPRASLRGWFPTYPNMAFSGKTRAGYIDYVVRVLYGDTSDCSKWLVAIDTQNGIQRLNENITLTGRYFRLECVAWSNPGIDPDTTGIRFAKVMLEKLAMELYA